MQEHYFSKSPKSKFREEDFTDHLRGNDIKIKSASSIFSVKEVDFGTRLLIENAQIESNSSVLDLGCGYGVVGISIKKAFPTCDVMLSDVNERAVLYSSKNCKQNKVECDIIKSDLFESPKLQKLMFNQILTNPPFSAGKELCMKIIRESKEHLLPRGSLQLVAPHNKGGESLKKIMFETFGNVDELVKKSGYRVYISYNE